MSFDHDVFISYPHISDQDDQSGNNGWVAKFHVDLKEHLSESLGRDARIWRDNRMPVGAVIGDAICNRLRKSKVLLCVLSPAYVQSEWCLRELKEFRRLAAHTGGLTLDDQSRIMTVVKTPTEHHPEGLSESLFSEFYDEDTGAPLAFGHPPGGYRSDQYLQRLNKLAWDITKMIKGLGDDTPRDITRSVYLAETTSDLDDYRNKLKDELVARQLVVLPSAPLPSRTADEYADAVCENLDRTFMSIHLMGSSYGQIPERGERKSIVAVQNELAAKRSSIDKRFTRIIWIPEKLESPEATQLEFLEALRNSEEALSGAELIERPFENLKTRLIQKITGPQSTPPENNLVRIYLMCDKQDAGAVNPVESYLFERGFEVIPPPEEGDEEQVIRYHKDNVLLCDATLILYGKANRNWVRFCLDDLSIKAKGWGREKPIPCRAILRTSPETDQKNEFRTQIASVLNPPWYDDKLSRPSLEVSLRDFITCLESTLSTES